MFADERARAIHLFGSAIVWVAIFLGTALVLSGTDGFAKVFPVELAGVVWSVVLVPMFTRPSKKTSER